MQNKPVPPSKRSGIYEIVHVASGKRYIGSAMQFGHRWSVHRSYLRIDRHHSILLQRAWNRYGETAFEFRILEFVDDHAMLIQREQFYLDTEQPAYNRALIAGSRMGMENTPEHRARISAALNTPESQAKLSARWKGKTQSEEHLAARAEGMRGNKNGASNVVSPEQRAAMNAGRNAKIASGEIVIAHSLETREKIAAKLRGKKRPPEVIERMREGLRKAAADREAEHGPSKSKLEAQQAVRRGSPEFAEKIRAAKAAKAALLTPEQLEERREKGREAARKAREARAAKKAAGHVEVRTPEMRERYRQAKLAADARMTSEQAAAQTEMLRASAARMHAEMAANKAARLALETAQEAELDFGT
jgi:group I intron endonuclease